MPDTEKSRYITDVSFLKYVQTALRSLDHDKMSLRAKFFYGIDHTFHAKYDAITDPQTGFVHIVERPGFGTIQPFVMSYQQDQATVSIETPSKVYTKTGIHDIRSDWINVVFDGQNGSLAISFDGRIIDSPEKIDMFTLPSRRILDFTSGMLENSYRYSLKEFDKRELQTRVVCFSGMPDTGKTTIAQRINQYAKKMGKQILLLPEFLDKFPDEWKTVPPASVEEQMKMALWIITQHAKKNELVRQALESGIYDGIYIQRNHLDAMIFGSMNHESVIARVMEEIKKHDWIYAEPILLYGDYVKLEERRGKNLSDAEREQRYDILADLSFRISKIGDLTICNMDILAASIDFEAFIRNFLTPTSFPHIQLYG